MTNNTQSRKWIVTHQNPIYIGMTHETIKSKLEGMSLDYYCMADEIATTGTYHTHVYLMSNSPIRFSTIKNRFPLAHIEKAYGSAKDNRDYIRKEGKWANTDKAKTSVPGTFEEWGDMPSPSAEKSPKMAELIQNIQDGKTTSEIILDSPNLAFHGKDIDFLRETLLGEEYTSTQRKVEVTYLFGASGAGKTYSIFQQYPAKEICRITNYRGNNGVNFDAYHGQDVLVFEEFNSQIPITDMLNYLDVYPLMLPARYNDRVACYTKIFITSNIPLTQQYLWAKCNSPETWRAFNRRIHNVIEYLPDGTTRTLKGGHTNDEGRNE